MLQEQSNARAIRQRLFNPPNGRVSSERDIVSQAEARRLERERLAKEKAEAEEQEHNQRLQEAMLAAQKKREQWQHEEEEWARRLNERAIQVRTIIVRCCAKYGIPPVDVLGQRRKATVCHVRHIIAYLSTELTTRSLPEIGRVMGGRDHTTILHSRNKIAGMIAADPKFAAEIAEIRAALESPA